MLKKINPFILLVVLLTIPTLIPLTKQGFFPTQDFIYVARVYEMVRALSDWQFPVRWVGDFRYGEPLFNYYAPLSYYVGALIKLLGFSYLETVKILFGLGFVLSGLSMFFLARRFFGNVGGFLAAIFYIYAPYHSVDVYVRGALAESWALIFFPLIFLFAYNLSQSPTKKNVALFSLSLAGLFFTHNIMTVLSAPFIFGWMLFWVWQTRSGVVVKNLFLGLMLGIGLASSFLLPAFFEKDLVQSNKLITGYFDYRAHFVTIQEMYLPSWGYGASLWGPVDDMSFQVGVVHLLTVMFIGFAAVFAMLRRRFTTHYQIILFLIMAFGLSLFMQHNRSQFIWSMFPTLAFTQFPWRFLGISIFLVSFIVGGVGLFINKKLMSLAFVLAAVVLFVNFDYFRPESYYLDSVDEHYISDKTLSVDDKLPKDYLPIWVKRIKDEKQTTPYAVSGKVEVQDFKHNSKSATFTINASENAEVEVPITYFPGWRVAINNKEVKIEDPAEEGFLKFKVGSGISKVRMYFSNTWIRNIGDTVSIISIIASIYLLRKKI